MTLSSTSMGVLYESLCEAMLAADTAKLDDLLAGGFTLTHMTGYVQSKAEWLAAIASGEMQYHRMETLETTSSPEGSPPGLTARTLTDATIWGSRATWRLTLQSHFECRNDECVITGIVASTW
jgi:hypothetical protein